jgi:hypothetical protein
MRRNCGLHVFLFDTEILSLHYKALDLGAKQVRTVLSIAGLVRGNDCPNGRRRDQDPFVDKRSYSFMRCVRTNPQLLAEHANRGKLVSSLKLASNDSLLDCKYDLLRDRQTQFQAD